MKNIYYAIAVKDQILGIDTGNDFNLYFGKPSIRDISDYSVFCDKEGAEHFLGYCKKHYKDSILNHAEVKKIIVDISLEET